MNDKVERILLYVGAIGAVIASLAYLFIMVTLVVGIEAKMDQGQLIVVSVIGAAAGIMITWSLRGQGIALAANEEESKTVMKEYHQVINKTKKAKSLRTIKYHVVVQSITDIGTKVITVGLSTYFMVSIFMEGAGDLSLIGLAVANILMFISFGILSLRKAYKFYIEEHLAAIREITARHRINDQIDETNALEEIVTSINNKIEDQVGSVPLEGKENGELRECKVFESTSAGETEPDTDREIINDVQLSLHDTGGNTEQNVSN